MREIYEELRKKLGDSTYYNVFRGEANFECPSCHHASSKDSKKSSLAINIKTGKYQCWYCGFSGKPATRETNVDSIKRLFKKIGQKFEIERASNYREEIDLDALFLAKEEVKEKIVEIPKTYRRIYDNLDSMLYKKAIKYLQNREIYEKEILKYDIHFSVNEQRILFPSYDDIMKLNYYVARSILENETAKYRNPIAEKSKIIFNEIFVDWNKPIVLVEGIFDAITTRENSIPILGSYIGKNSKLFKLILKNNSKIILVLDSDAKNKQNKIAHSLISNGIETYYVDFGDEERDISEMGTESFQNFYNNNLKKYTYSYILMNNILDKIGEINV
jgi:hypothetical protein